METMGSRLKIARQAKALTQVALAKRIRIPISPGTISHIESGRNENSRFIVWIAAALNVRAEWLCTGEGEMFESWHWPGIPSQEISLLPQDVIDDIADYIELKLNKHRKSFPSSGTHGR